MKCLYCGSESTEVSAVLKEGDKTIWIVECNRCASISRIVGRPDNPSDDEETGHSNIAAPGHGSGFPSVDPLDDEYTQNYIGRPDDAEGIEQGYDDESCPYCGGVVMAEYLYDDDVMFERFECSDCGHRWYDPDEERHY